MSGAHDKLIAIAAKAMLQPLGLRRKGQSRLWIGDQSWWLAVVEFQPSGFSKGSYLNVAAHWLWSAQGYISFDYGSGFDGSSRAADFEVYEPAGQFEEAAHLLASVAAREIGELIARLPSIETTADLLLSREAESPARGRGSWPTFNAAVAAGLAGRTGEADGLLRSVTDPRVKGSADRYIDASSDPARFRATAASLIASQREALRLPAPSTEPF